MITKGVEVIGRRWIFWSLFIIGTCSGSNSNGVLITKLDVPHSIENGTKEYTDLDCEYTLRDNMTDLLVVTWLYNDHTIIYKWIPSHDVRATHSMLRNRVDMDFTVSTVPWEMYRALRILKPTTELSGKYTCDVSTKDGHSTAQSELIVYVKPKEYDLELIPNLAEDQVNISCWANRVYPEPKLTISYEENKNRVKLTDVNEESSWVSGTYDVRVFSLINRTSLPSHAMFSCDVKIPKTSYLVRKELPYRGFDRLFLNGTEDDSGAFHTRSFLGPVLFATVFLNLI